MSGSQGNDHSHHQFCDRHWMTRDGRSREDGWDETSETEAEEE